MSTTANTQLIRRFTSDFINTANPTVAAELIAPAAVFHAPGMPPLQGPDGYMMLVGMLRAGFPDVQWTLEDTVAEGDKVAARFTMRGTHTGAFMGAPATGKGFAVTTMGIYRIAGGQIVEEHGLPDMMGLMMQIGAIPAPSAPPL
jgi:predicted ester cyclase